MTTVQTSRHYRHLTGGQTTLVKQSHALQSTPSASRGKNISSQPAATDIDETQKTQIITHNCMICTMQQYWHLWFELLTYGTAYKCF